MEPTSASAPEGLSEIEAIKDASNLLRGSIAKELSSDAPTFAADTAQVLKFHGVYLQDNRDVRSERIRAKQPLDHRAMVRVAIPGGRLSAEQYLALDALCDVFGNGTLRLTTRQGIQYHFATKAGLEGLLRGINNTLLTTWGGCGDVVRNVTACPASHHRSDGTELDSLANAISRRYKAPAEAYYELWVDGERVPADIAGAPSVDASLYGPSMLPRKFKIGVTTSNDNCVDVLTNDIGVVVDAARPALVRLYVGGGMGRSGTDDTTFARIADLLGEVKRSDVLAVIDALVALQRDEGNRSDRAHARFKYLVERIGVDAVRDEVQRRCGITVAIVPPDTFPHTDDHLGSPDQTLSSRTDYGIKLPSGRISDTDAVQYRTAIAEIVRFVGGELAITPRGDLLLLGVDHTSIPRIERILMAHHVPTASSQRAIERNAFACVALPTCGLALAESERYLPSFLEEFGAMLASHQLEDEDIEIRMTGCPNGCARPYMGEIGIVGRSKRSYDLFIGGDREGTRMNELFARDVPRDQLVPVLGGIVERFAAERRPNERFGDFFVRLDETVKAALRPQERVRLRLTHSAGKP
jgi:sulfite reductase (ferredoxin)